MRNILIIIFFFAVSGIAQADDRIDDVYFSGKPVKIIISTKQDSLLYFPNPVKVKDDFANHAEVTVTNDVVIIKAKTIFESKKMIFQDIVTDKVFVFSVSSSHGENPRNVRLLLPSEKDDEVDNFMSGRGAYVTLTQHASMSLYYPERYSPNTKGISNVKLKKGNANYFVSFNAEANPVKSWKGFGLFITAVKIKNLESKTVNIDPRNHFRGEWLFLAPQHSWLGESAENNVTTVYVISERPFWESLL